MSSKACFVYMIEMNAPVYGCPPDNSIFKIGISENADKRFNTIKTSSAFPIRMVETWRLPHKTAARLVESSFHKAFRDERMMGEWFCAYPVAAMCHVEQLIADYWHQCWGTRGILEFLMSAGLNEDAASDLCLSLYGGVE